MQLAIDHVRPTFQQSVDVRGAYRLCYTGFTSMYFISQDQTTAAIHTYMWERKLNQTSWCHSAPIPTSKQTTGKLSCPPCVSVTLPTPHWYKIINPYGSASVYVGSACVYKLTITSLVNITRLEWPLDLSMFKDIPLQVPDSCCTWMELTQIAASWSHSCVSSLQ